MLAVACTYINAPGLQPNAPVVQATVPEILKQAYAMEPDTQKEIIIDHGDGLCSKVMIEPSPDEALNAFIDQAAHAGHQDEHNRRRSGLAGCMFGDNPCYLHLSFRRPGGDTMKEMTPEQRKKIRGEREWQRI